MLEAAGLQVSGIALPDHGALEPRPWPADAPCVIVTEKDAVKLSPQAADAAAVQVATLDLHLPDDLLGPLIQRLEPLRRR
jgi:tetraacyldisaccharide-1-P 4'-kinase